jgi:hypothetical protein
MVVAVAVIRTALPTICVTDRITALCGIVGQASRYCWIDGGVDLRRCEDEEM